MQDAVALADIRRPHTRDPAASTKQEARKASRSVKGPVVGVQMRREARTLRKKNKRCRGRGVGSRGRRERGVRKTRRPNHHGCAGIISATHPASSSGAPSGYTSPKGQASSTDGECSGLLERRYGRFLEVKFNNPFDHISISHGSLIQELVFVFSF